jgi:hypothetical protein
MYALVCLVYDLRQEALTGGGLLLDILSPDTALELSDGGGLAAALLWVELGVTLDEDVEASAGLSLVAVGRASRRVVGSEDLVAEVSTSLNGAVKVGESLRVSRGCLRVQCEVRVHLVALEGVDSVGSGVRSVGVGLSSAWVERVDEAAVGTDFNGSWASRFGGEGISVGPAYRGAGRRSDVGRRRVESWRAGGGSLCRGGSSSGLLLGLKPKPASLDVGTSTPLCQLGSSSTRGGSGSGSHSAALDVSCLCSLSRANRGTLSERDWDGFERVDIESLGGRGSSDEGGGPKDKVRTHSERLRCKT